jgi:hypothetical protein
VAKTASPLPRAAAAAGVTVTEVSHSRDEWFLGEWRVVGVGMGALVGSVMRSGVLFDAVGHAGLFGLGGLFCFVLFLLFFKSWGIIYYLEPTTIRIHFGRDKAGHHYHHEQAPVSRASRHPWPLDFHING